MKSALALVFMLSLTCHGAQIVTTSVPFEHQLLDDIDTSDGISREEAHNLADVYFHYFISGCGSVSDPSESNGFWESVPSVGLYSVPRKYKIRINRVNGTTTYEKKPILVFREEGWHSELNEMECSMYELKSFTNSSVYKLEEPLQLQFLSSKVFFTTNSVPSKYQAAIERIVNREPSEDSEMFTHASGVGFGSRNRQFYYQKANRVDRAPILEEISTEVDLHRVFGNEFGLSMFNSNKQPIEEFRTTLIWFDDYELKLMRVTAYIHESETLYCYVIEMGKVAPFE